MTSLEIWLLAVSVAMDCFSVSITSGIILRRTYWKTFITIGLFFGLFQAVMPLIGWCATNYFYHLIEQFDHWIAFGLLFFLGAKMIKESFGDEEDHHFDPTRFATLLMLAIATSIDALAVGISLAMAGNVNIFLAVALIGIITFAMSCLGVKIGNLFGSRFEKKAQAAGGIILLLLGTKILLEHLGVLG